MQAILAAAINLLNRLVAPATNAWRRNDWFRWAVIVGVIAGIQTYFVIGLDLDSWLAGKLEVSQYHVLLVLDVPFLLTAVVGLTCIFGWCISAALSMLEKFLFPPIFGRVSLEMRLAAPDWPVSGQERPPRLLPVAQA